MHVEKMTNFRNHLLMELTEIGFIHINFSVESDISNEDIGYILYKTDGAMLYFAVINSNCANNNWTNNHVIYQKFIEEFTERNYFRNTIVFNIVLTDSYDENLSNWMESSEEYMNQSIYYVNYTVNPIANDFKFSDKQPQNLIKINDLININLSKSESEPAVLINEKHVLAKIGNNANLLEPKITHEFIVYILIAINLLVFFVMERNGGTENVENLIRFGALSSYDVLNNNEYYRLFSSMFIHIGFAHLLSNSVSLFIFGTRVEKYYGRLEMLIIYIGSGLIGSLATLFTGATVSAGASGAIFGLIGSVLALTHIKKKSLEGLTLYTMIIFSMVSVMQGLLTPNIGNAAHIGGLIGGYLIGAIICKLSNKNQIKPMNDRKTEDK